MKIISFGGSTLFRISVHIGNQGHHRSRMVPLVSLPGFGQPDKFSQCQPSGIDAGDSG
jgi:hypothetical protein